MPLLVGGGGGLVCESVGKADLLSDNFDSKLTWKSVDLPLTCHASPGLTTLHSRSMEVGRHLFDSDPYGGTDHWVCFLLFLRADILAPRLSILFRRLFRLG